MVAGAMLVSVCCPCRWPRSPAPWRLQHVAQQLEAPGPSALLCAKVGTPSTVSTAGPLALGNTGLKGRLWGLDATLGLLACKEGTGVITLDLSILTPSNRAQPRL